MSNREVFTIFRNNKERYYVYYFNTCVGKADTLDEVMKIIKREQEAIEVK